MSWAVPACASKPAADDTAEAQVEQDTDLARARHKRSYTSFARIGRNAPYSNTSTFRPLNPAGDTAAAGPDLNVAALTTQNKAWSIVLATFPANEDPERFNAAMNAVVAAGITDAYPDRRGSSVVIAYGSFASGDDPDARQALQQIQSLQIDGKRPFQTALLVPPPLTSVEGSLPDFDLASLRAKVPGAAFTLQVAVYERTDGKIATDADLAQFRKAAEQAVMAYRGEGAEAFYYHTARASTVTIGIFREEDYSGRHTRPDGTVTTGAPVPSPALAEVIKKYPYTLINGQGLAVRSTGGQLQPSLVVEIPR